MFRIVLTFVLAISSLTMYGQVPSLMMTNKDFEVRKELAKREPWAAAILETLIHDADEFPSSYEERFGLTSVELPPEGGQWLHWYVCPETGTPLQFHPPNHNVCPDTGRNIQAGRLTKFHTSFETMRSTRPH